MQTMRSRASGDEPGAAGDRGSLTLAACATDDAFAACILRSIGSRARPATVAMIAVGDDREAVPRATTKIRAALEASWVAPLPLVRGVGTTSWGGVAIGRSSRVVVAADRANDAARALAGHAFWEAAIARLRSGGHVVAFGAAAAALGTTGLDGHRTVRGLGLVPFGVAVADPADEPQGGSAIRRCAPIERLEPVLVLDGNAAVRWDGIAWRVIGNETVHARLDGHWFGVDPGHDVLLSPPMPFTGTHQLGKPA